MRLIVAVRILDENPGHSMKAENGLLLGAFSREPKRIAGAGTASADRLSIVTIFFPLLRYGATKRAAMMRTVWPCA